MERTQQPLTTVTIQALRCRCFVRCQPCPYHTFSTKGDGCISIQCICAGRGCGSSVEFYDCLSPQNLPVSFEGIFQERVINTPHCDNCRFQFQYCKDFNSLRLILPSDDFGINHIRTNGIRINCGCLIELVPCGLPPSRTQQLPGLGNTVFQAPDLDPSMFEQAQGVTLPGNPDARQPEVAGPPENAHPLTNGHLTADDLEASWNREYNEDQYPLRPLQQLQEGEVSSTPTTQDQRQQRRHTEMISAVIPNHQHAPREPPMLPTEIDGDHENDGGDEMQYPPTLRRGHLRPNIINGAAAPRSSTVEEQAARILLRMSGSSNVGGIYLGAPTGTSGDPIDVNSSPNLGVAMEDEPALSIQNLHAATSMAEQDQTDSNAAGGGSRQRPNDEPLAAAPIFPQGTTSTRSLGSRLRARRRRSSARSWGSVSRPMSAAPTASDADATIRQPVANLHNADLGERTRHTKHPSDSFEASAKDKRVSRPVYYLRGFVPGNTSNLMSLLEEGGSGRMPYIEKGGDQIWNDVCVPYLPSQPMGRDPPPQTKIPTSNATRDTLKAFSYFAISAVVMALVAAGLSRQR